MACLRREALEGRGRDVQCDEEGCELRLKSFAGVGIIDDDPSAAHCVLQLRLRAGDSEDARFVIGNDGADDSRRDERRYLEQSRSERDDEECDKLYAFLGGRWVLAGYVTRGGRVEWTQAREELDPNEVKWRGEPWPKIELSESLLSYEPTFRRAVTEMVDREERAAIENYLGLKLDDYQWHLFKLLLGRVERPQTRAN